MDTLGPPNYYPYVRTQLHIKSSNTSFDCRDINQHVKDIWKVHDQPIDEIYSCSSPNGNTPGVSDAPKASAASRAGRTRHMGFTKSGNVLAYPWFMPCFTASLAVALLCVRCTNDLVFRVRNTGCVEKGEWT